MLVSSDFSRLVGESCDRHAVLCTTINELSASVADLCAETSAPRKEFSRVKYADMVVRDEQEELYGDFSSAVYLIHMLVSGIGAASGTGEEPRRDGAASGGGANAALPKSVTVRWIPRTIRNVTSLL